MTLRQDLTIQQNTSWAYTYTYNDANGSPVDLTGYSAAMSIKRALGQTVVPRAYLSSGADAVGGTITLGGALGTVAMAMTPAQTLRLVEDFDLWAVIDRRDVDPRGDDVLVKPQVALVYDLNLTAPDGSVVRPIEGIAVVRRSATP